MYSLVGKHQGSAIIIAMITLVLLTAITTVFLEKVFNFSQSINGIERSNIAYYNALSLIEVRLMTGSFTKYDPWKVTGYINTGSTFSGEIMTVSTGSDIIPAMSKGNSPFHPDYNLITLGDPVQLVIPDGLDWSNVHFTFRVPRIGTNTSTGVSNTVYNSGFILWTFGNSGATLFASGESNIFRGGNINQAYLRVTNPDPFPSPLEGVTNSGTAMSFESFYIQPNYLGPSGGKCAGFNCTLKLSLIRPVPLDDGRSLPFLEYKIDFGGVKIPNQRMTIKSESYVNGFVRNTTVYLPQITTNTALDFAILQ